MRRERPSGWIRNETWMGRYFAFPVQRRFGLGDHRLPVPCKTDIRFCEVDLMKNPDTLLVGFDNAHGDDAAVLIVGRKAPGDSVQIVNQFQGKEALELYQRLLPKHEA